MSSSPALCSRQSPDSGRKKLTESCRDIGSRRCATAPRPTAVSGSCAEGLTGSSGAPRLPFRVMPRTRHGETPTPAPLAGGAHHRGQCRRRACHHRRNQERNRCRPVLFRVIRYAVRLHSDLLSLPPLPGGGGRGMPGSSPTEGKTWVMNRRLASVSGSQIPTTSVTGGAACGTAVSGSAGEIHTSG
jgi:hypothetical protein